MSENRVMLQVFVDLDAVPGEFHTREQACSALERLLKMAIPHYNPVVLNSAGREEALQALEELEEYGVAFANEGSGPGVDRTLQDVYNNVAVVKTAIVNP